MGTAPRGVTVGDRRSRRPSVAGLTLGWRPSIARMDERGSYSRRPSGTRSLCRKQVDLAGGLRVPGTGTSTTQLWGNTRSRTYRGVPTGGLDADSVKGGWCRLSPARVLPAEQT